MEIITGIERRRRWRVEDKPRIVAEAEQPGACFAEIARRNEVSRGLLWNWRSQARRGKLTGASFLPVQVVNETAVPDRNVSMTLRHSTSRFRLGCCLFSGVG